MNRVLFAFVCAMMRAIIASSNARRPAIAVAITTAATWRRFLLTLACITTCSLDAAAQPRFRDYIAAPIDRRGLFLAEPTLLRDRLRHPDLCGPYAHGCRTIAFEIGHGSRWHCIGLAVRDHRGERYTTHEHGEGKTPKEARDDAKPRNKSFVGWADGLHCKYG